MRSVFILFIIISFAKVNAQTVSAADYLQNNSVRNKSYSTDSIPNKKWFLNSYNSISTGMTFFNSGSAYFISAPIGLQLNRKLTNNLYAFAGVSAAPAYMNFNHSFLSADINKTNPSAGFYRTNNFGIYSRAEMGLMYINDAKTFSISGSVGIERSSNPIFLNQPVSNTKLNSPAFQNR
jgi:hypothetical protein